jgi:hypothetical protein
VTGIGFVRLQGFWRMKDMVSATDKIGRKRGERE